MMRLGKMAILVRLSIPQISGGVYRGYPIFFVFTEGAWEPLIFGKRQPFKPPKDGRFGLPNRCGQAHGCRCPNISVWVSFTLVTDVPNI